jgi:DNA invertase Pin-like site-specific DNA recombinase
MTIYAYTRVSREDQNLDLQIDAVRAIGVADENILREKLSGVKSRCLFNDLLNRLKPGDVLAVWKVDRLGRNAVEVLRTGEELESRGVALIITTLGIDTRTPAGKLVYGMMAQLAQFERDQLIERTKAGLEAARRGGAKLGRAHSLTQHQRRQAAKMIDDGKSYGEIAALFSVSRSVVFRSVQQVRRAAA